MNGSKPHKHSFGAIVAKTFFAFKSSALKFVVGYALAALLWILLSDTVVAQMGSAAAPMHTLKGVLFVLFTAGVLYWILLRHEAVVAVKDVEAMQHANKASRAALAFSMVTEIDKRIMGSNNLISIYQHTCNRLVQCDNYNLVWIGVPDDGPDKKVNIMCSAGPAVNYLEALDVGWGSTTSGSGLTGAAARTHQTQILNNIQHAKLYKPWHKRTAQFGLKSTIAVPVMVAGRVAAILRVYSPQHDGFHLLEKHVLEILADHLSYAIRSVDGVSEINRAVHERDTLQQKLGGVLMGTVNALARTIEKRDPYTAGHQQSVCNISIALGQKLGLSQERLDVLRLGSLIHDIGKVGVPADILTKPSKLSEAEYSIIKEHSMAGYEILGDLDFEPVKRIVVEHHERLDGSGYPKGLTKDDIMLESRIVSVADVIDSVTSHRPYRPALGIEKAREILHEGNGNLFDPDVVAAFDDLYREGFHFVSQQGDELKLKAVRP